MPPEMADTQQSLANEPDYLELIRFLITPFLESADSLRLHCEKSRVDKLWIRVAFDPKDKGSVYGRGGRNIQAIRKVLNVAASLAGQTVRLDIYGDSSDRPSGERSGRGSGRSHAPRSRPRRN
ncbi:MAG: KH domain-containing protein [Cyanobacteria bacterium P01_H01_bin.15]